MFDNRYLYYYNEPIKSQKIWIFEDNGTLVAVRESNSVKNKTITIFLQKKKIKLLLAFIWNFILFRKLTNPEKPNLNFIFQIE